MIEASSPSFCTKRQEIKVTKLIGPGNYDPKMKVLIQFQSLNLDGGYIDQDILSKQKDKYLGSSINNSDKVLNLASDHKKHFNIGCTLYKTNNRHWIVKTYLATRNK